ncbi:hypothetical protein KYG33_06830 [Chryseobacterium sp. D764]|uniref:hypothetical protein n=1 Tax=Chryseobacterium sp. D764 TaxID=2856522 RepID=UPI001C59975B|nr:hypothetical protein [Chryseobacterium sp. D764]QXU50747.1 hypothetical protein KYG33_06830 [Chryseobacterium sp. D764]
MKTKIIELIHIIKRHPGMVFFNGANAVLKDYIHFFEGVFYSLGFSYNIDFEREISQWYQNRTNFKAPNMNWFAQFEHVNKDLSEIEKTNKFLDILEEFFKNHDALSSS